MKFRRTRLEGTDIDWLELNISENKESPFSTQRFVQSCYKFTLGGGGGEVTDRVIKYTGTQASDSYSTQASQSCSSTSLVAHWITTTNPRREHFS